MPWPRGRKRLPHEQRRRRQPGVNPVGDSTTAAVRNGHGDCQDGPNGGSTPATPKRQAQQGSSSHDLQTANPANQTPPSKRVGPRELQSILKNCALDSSSSDDDSDEDAAVDSSSDRFQKNSPHRSTNSRRQSSAAKQTPRKERALRRQLFKSAHRNTTAANEYSDVTADMSGQQGKWREEQVLIICPGSQTTMAQLGCSELTPPAHRIPTRMFKDEELDEYRPFHTFKRKRSAANGTNGTESDAVKADDDDFEYVEDRDSVEGAVYPIQGGRIVNMEAFLAFLDHVHSLLTTTYHNTPIVLMASPQWTRPDCETIARYIFEKTKTPALCLLHSAVASQYGLKWATMTVVDIGFEKVDVTCIYDNVIVSHKDLGYPTPVREISGGEVFTQKLLTLLKEKSFTYDMAEQMKKSSICEVLPYAAEKPELMDLPTEGGAGAAIAEAPKLIEPLKVVPATATIVDEDNGTLDDKIVEDGVLDVANIVTSGNARDFLAKKEKEKAEKAKLKKAKALEAESGGAKPIRLPNSKRKINVFHYEDMVHEDVQVPISNGAPKVEAPAPTNGEAAVPAAATTATAGEAPATDAEPAVPAPAPAPATDAAPAAAPATGETSSDLLPFAAETTSSVTERRTKRVRRDVEVGLERFLFADRGEIDRITETIYRAVQSIDEIYKRSGCWDNIVFVGNGSRLRGLKENIIQTLTARHLISPSTATIFTSELPSNMATPTGTGAQTPTGSFTGQLPTTSSVNPLLQAATTASLGIPGQNHAPGSSMGETGPSHHSHAQTPTSIKLATMPSYLAEWTKNGFEEAMFLGSLVAARLAYCIHNLDLQATEAQRTMSLNRVDYNEFGPKAVRTHSMLG